MRLIDADVFEIDMQKEWENNNISNSEWMDIRQWLKDAPTIEAETVKHGRWSSDCVCSECGEVPRSGMEENYCPNCGAKMIPTIPKEIIDAVLGEDEVEE